MLCNSDRCFSSIMWQQHSKHSVVPIMSAPTAGHVPRREESPDVPGAPDTEVPPPAQAGDPQRQHLVDALEKSGWVQAKAARLLGITPRQIGYAILKYGIDVKRF